LGIIVSERVLLGEEYGCAGRECGGLMVGGCVRLGIGLEVLVVLRDGESVGVLVVIRDEEGLEVLVVLIRSEEGLVVLVVVGKMRNEEGLYLDSSWRMA
jgi:hypothetical protein